jgi:hypothetical protein
MNYNDGDFFRWEHMTLQRWVLANDHKRPWARFKIEPRYRPEAICYIITFNGHRLGETFKARPVDRHDEVEEICAWFVRCSGRHCKHRAGCVP